MHACPDDSMYGYDRGWMWLGVEELSSGLNGNIGLFIVGERE